MTTLIHSISPMMYTIPALTRSVIASVHVFMVALPAVPNTPAAPAGFGQIEAAVNGIEQGVFKIATALAALMVVVAGMMIMVDREASMEKRGQRLAFLKTVLIGYAVVVGATFLLNLVQQVVGNLK